MPETIEQIKKKVDGEKPINFNIQKSSDVIGADYGEYSFIVDKLVPRDGITFLSSQPKAGKSWFLLHLIDEMTKEDGTGFLFKEFKVKKTKLLLVDEENSLRGLQRRMNKLNSDMEFELMSQQNFKLLEETNRQWLIDYIKDKEIELIVFDSFRRIHNKEENDSGEMANIYEFFKEIMNATKCAILCTHHNRKLQRFEKLSMDAIRGSGDIPAMAESLILMQTERLKNGDSNGNSTMIMPILREDVSLGTFKVEWYDNLAGGIEFMYKEFDEAINKLQVAKDSIVELFRKNNGWYLTKEEIFKMLEGCGAGKSKLKEAIDFLMTDDKILNRKKLTFDEYNLLKNSKKVFGNYEIKSGKKSRAEFFFLESENVDNELFNVVENQENLVDMDNDEFNELFKQ